MKKIITTLAIALMFFGANAQEDPPHPNSDLNPTEAGSGNTPVGGGAAVGGGIGILLVLGAAYGLKKVYHRKIKKLNE